MQSKLIDITKPVKTRDGKTVTQLTRFNVPGRCLVGTVCLNLITWNEKGSFLDSDATSDYDIFNVTEKKTVPLSFGDVLPGDLFKWPNNDSVFMVVLASPNVLHFQTSSSVVKYNYSELMATEYSQNRGKTWKPAYKEIEI